MNSSGLRAYPDTIAGSLPYGRQKRLEIARAITEPRLILLDESTAGMNPQETGEMMELIKTSGTRQDDNSYRT